MPATARPLSTRSWARERSYCQKQDRSQTGATGFGGRPGIRELVGGPLFQAGDSCPLDRCVRDEEAPFGDNYESVAGRTDKRGHRNGASPPGEKEAFL